VSLTTTQSQSEAPVVPERATQGAETCGREWSWVEASVWNERMLAALGNGVKGGKWFSLIDKVYRAETLKAAWKKVKANAGAAGVDGQSVERFAARAEMYLEELSTALKRGSYRPQPVRRVEIPKGGGRFRPLGIPVVKDRIVQTALKFVLEPIFEQEFLKMSYRFSPGAWLQGCASGSRAAA
jgi:RNA-directed DNA polymerase